jgi:hypothetical protein
MDGRIKIVHFLVTHAMFEIIAPKMDSSSSSH